MIFWTLLGVLSLSRVTDAETTAAPTDEDLWLTYRLYDYLIHVDHPVKYSSGYERLRHVVNKTTDVLEFFESLADLYRNGTLGGCLSQGKDRCKLYINTNQSRFNAEFGRFLMGDKKANIGKVFAEDLMPTWNPDDFYDYSSGRFWLAVIFNQTFDSYNYLQANFAYALLGMSSKTPNPRWHCYDYQAEPEVSTYSDDAVLKGLAALMSPNCEGNTTNKYWSYAYDVQHESERFATKHDMNGGYSNRCFAKFFIRYHNYSADAYEQFVDRLATYLYRDTILYGLCVPSRPSGEEVDARERTRRKEWVKERMDIIGTGLFEARAVLDETPPTAPPPEGINASDATHTANQTWLGDVKAAVEIAIGKEEIPYPTPGDAFQLYKGIYSQIVGQLRQADAEPHAEQGSVDRTEEPFFDVLVYYPAFDSSEHCVKNASDHVIHGRVKNVNYVVSLRKHLNSNATLETRKKLEEYFKKSEKADQCDRISEINGKMQTQLLGDDGLSAIVSIKCARKFVWYELAYQYFQAAYTETPKVETEGGSKYSSNCGMLVLFP